MSLLPYHERLLTHPISTHFIPSPLFSPFSPSLLPATKTAWWFHSDAELLDSSVVINPDLMPATSASTHALMTDKGTHRDRHKHRCTHRHSMT